MPFRSDLAKSKLFSRLSNERGVFGALFVVVALSLFFVLIILGIDTGRIKAAQSELRTKVDQICGELAWSPSSYNLSLRRYRDYLQKVVNDKVLQYGKIQNAKLIMPTMPASGGFNFKIGQEYNPNITADGPPYINTIKDFDDPALNMTGCVLEGGQDCNFQGTLFGDLTIPAPMQDNLVMAGNVVMCEVSVQVGTILLGRFLEDNEELVSVKSAFWTPLRGVNPIYNKDNPIQTSPALTIAIGTQLNTSPWDGRFRFSSIGNSPVDNQFRNRYDPFYTVNRNAPKHEPFAAASGRIYPYQDSANNYPAIQSISSIDNTKFGGANGINAQNSDINPSSELDSDITTQNFSFPFTAVAGEIVSDREVMLTACMNPLVLMRNTFVSTIIELASRHGQLRNMTEVLHINPMHRAKNMSYGGGGNSYLPNQPAQIVTFGEDIALPRYQIPYVFFNSGSNSNEYPEPELGWPYSVLGINTYSKSDPSGGWINPFSNNGVPGKGWIANNNPELASHHALVASQLRSCYHLYDGAYHSTLSPTKVGLQRYGRYLEFLSNFGFYPTGVRGLYSAPNSEEQWPEDIKNIKYSKVPIGGASQHYWDQCSPWGGVDSNCTGQNLNQSRLLTAAEVASVLGTTQLCPYNQNSLDPVNPLFSSVRINSGWGIGDNLKICPPSELKNASTTPYNGDTTISSYELRPDVGAVMRYALGLGNGGILPPPSDDDKVEAIRSPGLFPIINNGLTNKPFLNVNSNFSPASDAPYKFTKNELSTMLLVLHQPLTREQIDDLKLLYETYYKPQWQVTNNDRRVGRPIVIIYMPANEFDAAAAGVFDEVFGNAGASMNVPNSASSPVTVLNFSPFDEVWGPPCGPGNNPVPAGVTEVEIFRNYWQCMLLDSEAGIVAQAQRVFRERITRRELKL